MCLYANLVLVSFDYLRNAQKLVYSNKQRIQKSYCGEKKIRNSIYFHYTAKHF